MITENNKSKKTGNGLVNPKSANNTEEKKEKKISVGKNDIVERDSNVITDDGRQLLK
jgi:hypothetical protein